MDTKAYAATRAPPNSLSLILCVCVSVSHTYLNTSADDQAAKRVNVRKQNRIYCSPARQKGNFGRNFAYFLLIFHLFYAYGTSSAVFKLTCLRNLPISIYFPPIFCLKWYPILVINSSMEPICCFSAHMFTDSAYFPPIFYSFSAHFPPNILPTVHRSCLARSLESLPFQCRDVFFNKS